MKLGTWGEDTAAGYLTAHGYKIIERNFSCRIGEIDIIAEDGDTIVFAEVKTRRSMRYGLPCESITDNKKRHILRTIKYYLMVRGIGDRDLRVDVVEILHKEGISYVRHIRNAIQGG